MAYCVKCGESGAYSRIYEDYKGNKSSYVHCDNCASQIYCYLNQERRDYERRVAGAKAEREKAQQEQKDERNHLSDCYRCGKRSSLYHYIYDKRVGKLISTTSNATDPRNQYVFCTKEHFKDWAEEKFNKIAELETINEGFRLQNEKLQRKIDEALEKAKQEANSIVCENCASRKEGRHWVNKQDHKTFCSESCYDEYYLESNKCANCQRAFGAEKTYFFPDDPTKHYCVDCKPIIEERETTKTQSSPINTSNTPSSPSTSSNYSPPPSPITNPTPTLINCYECKKTISIGQKVYVWPHESDKKYCESCGQERELVIEYLKSMLDGLDLTTLIQKSSKLSARNKTNLLIAQRIAKGEQVNIDALSISKEDKQGLEEFQQEVNQKRQLSQERDTLNKTLFWASLFWIAVIGLIIWLVVRWRRKKREKELLQNSQ